MSLRKVWWACRTGWVGLTCLTQELQLCLSLLSSSIIFIGVHRWLNSSFFPRPFIISLSVASTGRSYSHEDRRRQ